MIVERKYSYEELAQALGITPRAARALANQNSWRSVRQDGKVRVFVPSDALEGRRTAGTSPGRAETRVRTTQPAPPPATDPADAVVSLKIRIAGLEGQIKALMERADAERRRADGAIRERNEWRGFARALAESIPNGVRWWRRDRKAA